MAPEYYFAKSRLGPKKEGAKICLFLDFDGTLVPIQNDPGACVLSPEVKDRLVRLASSPKCLVAVLSGRSLADIKQRVPVEGIYCGGNHGLAIEGPGLSFVHPDAITAKEIIEKVRVGLEPQISHLEGPWIEDKGFGFTLHYRQAGREAGAVAREALRRTLSRTPERLRVALLKGKKTLELIPRTSWDKGRAALFILAQSGFDCLPVFAGDDLTDESAFSALAQGGITVRVGRSIHTSARYYLKSQREILPFLLEIERFC